MVGLAQASHEETWLLFCFPSLCCKWEEVVVAAGGVKEEEEAALCRPLRADKSQDTREAMELCRQINLWCPRYSVLPQSPFFVRPRAAAEWEPHHPTCGALCFEQLQTEVSDFQTAVPSEAWSPYIKWCQTETLLWVLVFQGLGWISFTYRNLIPSANTWIHIDRTELQGDPPSLTFTLSGSITEMFLNDELCAKGIPGKSFPPFSELQKM